MTTATESRPAVKTARKPRPKPARSLRILERATAETNGYAAVEISVGKKTDTYLVLPIPADFGRGFEVEKLTADLQTAETYHVNLDGTERSCTCKGHTHHGHCKHADGLAALIARKAL